MTIMKTLYTIYTNFAKRNLARFLTVFTILFTIGIGQILGATASHMWDLTFSSASWTSTNCETYFTQPYGMKKVNAYIINKNIDDFKQYAATATSIQIGVKSLCNGATTSKLTIYLVDKDGNTVGSGMEITPDNKSDASNTTYKYVTFISNLSTATGYKIQCTTYGKNVLVNGSSYKITYDDSSSGSGNTGGGNDSDGCTWELVTDASTLAAGDRIVIAAAGYDYAMGDNSSNGEYRIRTAITKNENKIATTNDVQIIILEEGTKTNTFAFNVDDSYLYAASSSSNHLKTKTALDANGSWSITIANNGVATIKAQGDKTHNWIKYNASSGQERFSCYGSGQSDVVIYKEICAKETTINLYPNFGTELPTIITTGEKSYTLPACEFEREGYTFSNWNTKSDGNGDNYFPDDEITLNGTAVTLYAQWTAQQYNIIYKDQNDANFSGNHQADYPTKHTYGTATTLKDATKTGYTFGGWYKESDCSGTEVATLGATEYTNDITLYAKWTPTQYTITYNGLEGATHNNPENYTIETETFTFNPPSERVGYNFVGWMPTTIEKGSTGDKIVTAQWEGKQLTNFRTLCDYDITWLVGEDSYTAGSPTTTVQAGHTITTLPTNPLDNALGCCSDKFMGWTTSTAKTIDDQYLYETIEEIQTKFPSIYEDLNFRAVFATTAQGVGTSIADFSEMGYENGTAVTDPIVLGDGEGHGDATITLAKAQSSSNAPTYYTDGEAVRIYAGGTITIASSYYIKNVAFTFAAGDGSNEITANSGTYADGVWTENVESPTNNLIITIGGEAGQHRRIASITVTTGVSGSQYTNYVTQCTTLPNPLLSGGSVSDIAVNCGDFSTLNNSQAIVFSEMQDLTCPVTFEVIEGDFLLSTAKDRAAQYQSKVKVTPYKTGENLGKLKNVYVRANATDYTENFTGKIKVTSDEITEDVIINLTANVTCKAFTLTTVDHLGNETMLDTYFAGEVIATEPTPSSDECTAGYTFDGWSTAEVKYGSVAYSKVTFPYTMPAKDVTLYPVYRINTTEDYHRVTSDLGAGDVDGNNWAGDYLIAYGNETFADGTVGGEDGIGKLKKKVDLSPHISNNSIPATEGDQYKVTLEAVTGGYVLKTQDGEYNYYTNNKENGISTSINIGTADDYPINVNFVSQDEINLCLTGDATGSVFRYNTTGYFRFYNNSGQKAVYLYKKTPLYTSSLICEEVTAENAMVTSTAGQTVKVNVTATMSNTKIDRTRELTAESDNADFTATITTTATENKYNVAVSYTPSVDDITDGTETASITIKVNAIPVTTFQVTGRHLPENFAIVAKVGNNWFALPSQGLNSETTPVGYPVEVDNNDNPIAVTSLPTKAKWALRNVYRVNGPYDRFAANGENLVFVNAENKTLYASKDNANIQTYAEYSNYATNNPDRYEWVPTTTDLVTYTLKNVGRDKDLSINVNATFGTHASNIASNNLRFLPINATYNPFDMQVVEWYPTKVLVQTEATLASVSATVGGIAVANPVVTKMGGKLYEISGLPLENNPTKILTISYDSYSCSKVIPIIISREEKTVTDAPFSTWTTSAYNYSDLVVRDGATLTINGTKQAPDKFVNVTIYPTAKIVVPENKQLSVYSLTFFGGIDEIYNGSTYELSKYGVPQLSLKGTLGKTVTTMDYIMRVNLDQMYQVGVPYDVNLNEITYWDGSAIKLGDELYVSAYDGQARANLDLNNTWIWEVNFAAKVLKAGIGYTISAEPQVEGDAYSILRMPMKSNFSSGSTEGAKTINVVAYDNQKSVAITDNHKGWNYLSNPYMTAISSGEADTKLVLGYLKETGTGPWEWVNDEIRYVTIPHDDGEDYYQKKFSEAELKPFKSFFVQIAQGGELSFALASRQNAPARYMEVQTEQEVEFEILLSNDKQSDNTGLLIADQYSPAYEINADLEKMIGSMSVYTIYGGYNLAYNAISPINASEWIPMGYIAPAAGEYTFRLDDIDKIVEQVEHVYLIDYEANNIVNLMDDEYEFTTDKEQNNNRFAINVVLSQDKDNTTTGLDIINGNVATPIKFIYHDKMYIQSGGVIYDGTGKQVTNINK